MTRLERAMAMQELIAQVTDESLPADKRRVYWAAYVELHKGRDAEEVRQMEQRRGLCEVS